jgi:ssDNA-binding replication factor A large subunit
MTKGNSLIEIGNLHPFMKNLTIQCIVIRTIESKRTTKDKHEIFDLLVSDTSGSIELVLWNEDGKYIRPGDILLITSGYVTLFKNILKLYVSKFGTVKRIGEFTMLFQEEPNLSKLRWESNDQDPQNSVLSKEV